MKSIFKILILGVVPILAVTMVADQAFAADKGSQLIFQANSEHVSFISVANTKDDLAVTVLVQYYNESMELVTWYLRVITGGGNFLVNPFDHMIPGTGTEDNEAGMNVMDAIMRSGKASTHYVIAVTAVGANLKGLPAENAVGVDSQIVEVQLTTGEGDAAEAVAAVDNAGPTANVLFPDYLVEDLDGTDNIDNGGVITSAGGALDADGAARTAAGEDESVVNNNLMQTEFDGDEDDTDNTSKNVGELTISNAEPVAFNHLSGHFTEALVGGGMSETDQTASWGGTPVIRPAVNNNNNMGMRDDYSTLTGADAAADAAGVAAGRLAEKDAGGSEKIIYNNVTGWSPGADNKGDSEITNGPAFNRGLNGGALVLPAAHGGGVAGAKQIMLLLSAADDHEEDDETGNYRLIPAKTGYMVTLLDNMGNSMMDPDAADAPIIGGVTEEEEDAKSAMIIVDGIQVWTDAGGCNDVEDEDPIKGPWTVGHLTELIDTGASGDFGGLETMGAIKFHRTDLKCVVEYGDGDQGNLDAA